jgi:hypothetical protein
MASLSALPCSPGKNPKGVAGVHQQRLDPQVVIHLTVIRRIVNNARVVTEEQASEGSYPHCDVNKRLYV